MEGLVRLYGVLAVFQPKVKDAGGVGEGRGFYQTV